MQIILNFTGGKAIKTNKKSKGFTLIELMIVISIIAILLALATYSFLGIRKKVRKTSCRENMRIIQQAVFMCQTENSNLDNKNLTIGKLFEMKYIKKRYSCPAGGNYSITDESENTRITCFKTNNGDDHGFVE